MVFKTMLRKQQENYSLTICDGLLPNDSTLIAFLKQPSGYHSEEYIIYDKLEGVNGGLIARKDGKSSLEFPESGTISFASRVIIKGSRISFNGSVNIEKDIDSVSMKKVSSRQIIKTVPPMIVSNEIRYFVFGV
jgi:hypothetical protein